ncbi:TPA: hypothetical protein QDC22_002491 [Burkholderia stabilis]|nr:hypothetical protein [Burkholderia stabilis]HDR9648650.1 hypothetical protein [Burkholderia stabilis]HDR9654504.1 hypothetical protein [Burkholderia stabilis]HDR9678370.1 hypothetical protein [Burkholderia stabilis]
MNAVTAETRQRLTKVSALIEENLVQEASSQLHELIRSLPPQEFVLASHDIRAQIERFQKQRRRDLLLGFDTRISSFQTTTTAQTAGRSVRSHVSPLASTERLSTRTSAMLRNLADHYIFKWTPNYRDTLQFLVDSALKELPDSGQLESETAAIGKQFEAHSKEIFSRGYQFQIERGLTADVAEIKSISGVQAFLDLVVLIYLEHRQNVVSAKEANVLWGITSATLTSIVSGYGSVNFDETPGWQVLAKNPRSWVPPLGFCRGSELLQFFDDFPDPYRDGDLHLILGAAAIAVERIAHKFHGRDILLPRLSRISVQISTRLDITLAAKRGDLSRDVLLTCFWQGGLTPSRLIGAAQSLRAAAIIGRFDARLDDGAEGVVNAAGLSANHEQIHHLSELVCASLETRGFSEEGYNDATVMTHNYARDFPLDDPDFRRQFMVERHSVKRLLERFDGSTGVHLWCSVRRSGKTTAAQGLTDAGGSSVVITQTMDRQLRQPIQNIFALRVREAFEVGKELADQFFVQIVRECALAMTATDPSNRRIVFIIDEYETLFGLINAHVRNDKDLKFMVALPLLSQMVDFSTSNLLILMGQRPDAYQVLSTQNQLSPLVQQYRFPLFEHFNNAVETEFTQFLSYVLSEKLPFDASFATAVFEETSGHPYLTANLMVDFCDWLIVNKYRLADAELSAQQFAHFVKDRLTPAALKRSPHYEFFHNQMAEYLSEQARTDEPWLFAIANILDRIAKKHIKTFTCTFNTYEQWAAPIVASMPMTAARLLTTGSQANFLEDKNGQVSSRIRLLSRLAASVSPKIN